MFEPSRLDAGRQPPQAPFELWRTTPGGGGPSSFPFLWVILIVGLVAIFGGGLWLQPWNGPAKPAEPDAKFTGDDFLEPVTPTRRPAPGVDTGRGAAPSGVDPRAVARAAEAERQRMLLDAKAAQRNALAAGVKAREALARWQSELDRWDSVSASLLDGDEGRPVAGGDDLVRQFRAVSQAERPSRAEHDEARDAVGQLLGPIEQAVRDPDDVLRPGYEVVRSLESRATQASQAGARWKEAVQEVSALATLARRRGLAGKSTLRQAIDDLEHELAAARAREKQAKLAEAEAKASAMDAAIAAAKITDAAEMRKAQAEAERKKLADAADRKRKREYARGDEIRRYLGSLMAKGFTQPIPSGNFAYPQKFAEERPVSLAALSNSGCLEPGLPGQVRLVCFMVHPDMDRPRWGMFSAPEMWKADQQRFIGQAQKLLIEYGEAMVDEGLLAP